MAYRLFDFCAEDGSNDFKEWTKKLQSAPRGKLNAKLDMLQCHGEDLFPSVLTGTDTPGILKLRIKGNVQLRPMLCKGPIEVGSEFTLLLGAAEVGGKLRPEGADCIADDRKTLVAQRPDIRRTKHERVS
jgi:hypothetical protein